jgi:hypothetical protein
LLLKRIAAARQFAKGLNLDSSWAEALEERDGLYRSAKSAAPPEREFSTNRRAAFINAGGLCKKSELIES